MLKEKELQRTWMVQRLNKSNGTDNPFAFGGNGRLGGFSEEAMSLFRPLFKFDYMGSAEFEFGEVPKAMQVINENIKDYETSELKIKSTTFYIIGRKEEMPLIKERIKEISKPEFATRHRSLREPSNLHLVIAGKDIATIGWLEMDNHFIFFTDKDVRDKLYQLFID